MSTSMTAVAEPRMNAYDEPVDLAKTETKPEPPASSRRIPLTADQQNLAAKYLPLAKSLAKPLKLNWPMESDEFESAALMALVEAAQSYDTTRQVKFATFARYRIWGALRDVQRGLITTGWKADPENAPAVSSMKYDSEEHGRVLGAEADPPVGHAVESAELVESWLNMLPPKHAEACREIYVHDRTQGEAASRIGCSKSRLSYLHKESIELLKDFCRYQSRKNGGC